MVTDRLTRQHSLVPRERLLELDVTVIGVGAIGRQVALQLAALGVPRLRLVDFDHVEATNVTTQGYLREEIRLAKVSATGRAVKRIDPAIELELIEDRYRSRMDIGQVLFCCVDSIETRGRIWRSVGRLVEFWCDGRMLGESIRVLSADQRGGREHYPTTLFSAGEAQVGSCTSHGTIYTASIAAGLMLHQFTRWLRGLAIEADVSFDLLAAELVVNC